MLRTGIIERLDSPYCNPLRIVVKNDKSVRLCLDACYINEIIESDHESPPLINELLQKFNGVTYMSTTDLATGYWQIPLHDSSRKYTAFLHNSKMYQFCRIPFGLKTAGSAFIRALNCAIGHQFDDVLTIYIDDFLVATAGSFYDHIENLKDVFTVLQEKNFTLKLEKSKFCKKEVKFLGHEFSTTGIRPQPDKLEIIRDFQRPLNRRELQQFIGVCTYYRQFMARHSNLLDPFRDILKEKNPWTWSEVHDRAFEDMKTAFVNCVQLNHYKEGIPYRLQTDASDLGVSGVLYQYVSNGDHRIISSVNRCLNSAEMNYTTTEKELLAIVYSITKLRTYLIGTKFEIITDHKGLTFLNTTAYLNARLICWSLILQQFDFNVSYCKEKDNNIADIFSRNPVGKFESSQPNNLSIDVLKIEIVPVRTSYVCQEINLGEEWRASLENLSELQKNDKYCKMIKEKLEKKQNVDFYVVKENILFRKDKYLNLWQVVIPFEIVRMLIDCIHSKLGHPGVYKTVMYLREYYYWKNMFLTCFQNM